MLKIWLYRIQLETEALISKINCHEEIASDEFLPTLESIFRTLSALNWTLPSTSYEHDRRADADPYLSEFWGSE